MRFEFNRTGAERKALVQAMGEILEVKPRYLGMPTAAYEVDYFHIDRTGAVEFDDRADSEEIENLLERLAERGIVAAPAETAQEGGTVGETAEPDNYAEAPETAPQKANMGLTVSMPRESFTDAALENLRKLVEAKGSLIKSALAVDSLPIETDGEKVSFPWRGTRIASRQRKSLRTTKNTPSGAFSLGLDLLARNTRGNGKSC